jgi:hypothetical protein
MARFSFDTSCPSSAELTTAPAGFCILLSALPLIYEPRALPQRDPGRRPALCRGPVDRFGHLEIVGSGNVLDDAVASVVPDVHAEGEVRFGFHGQARLDSPWPVDIYNAILLRPA